MELYTATALKPAREVQTRYGARYVVDLQLDTGEQETLWSPTDMEEIGTIRKGQQITVGRHRSGKLSYVDDRANAAAQPMGFHPTPIAPVPAPVSTKAAPLASGIGAAIAADVAEVAQLYAYCYQQARAVMPADAPAEALQACASSAFINVSRCHGLS